MHGRPWLPPLLKVHRHAVHGPFGNGKSSHCRDIRDARPNLADDPFSDIRPASSIRRAPSPPPPDALLADGDDVEIAGLQLRVLHTPGHTQGSVSLYTAGMLFSGDTLFRGSVGRLLQLPDDTIVLPGHRAETTIGRERQSNPFILQELRRLRGE